MSRPQLPEAALPGSVAVRRHCGQSVHVVDPGDGGPSAEAIVAAALLRDCALHTSGRYNEIGATWDDVYGEILPLMEQRTPTVSLAFEFWDGWVDAANHDWHYYPGIEREHWPLLAREIADALRHGTEITDPTLRHYFGPRPRRSLRERVKALLGRTDRQ